MRFGNRISFCTIGKNLENLGKITSCLFPVFRISRSATSEKLMNCDKTHTLVYPNGEVLWVPPCNWKVLCNFDIKRAPYAEHKCTIKVGSWTFDGNTMDLNIFSGVSVNFLCRLIS